jgi:phospholipase C
MDASPAFDLKQIKTLVVVMMENRSFDHMLGHLSLPPFGNRADIAGLDLQVWTSYANDAPGERPHMPFAVREDLVLPHDLPHERDCVATQIGPDRGMNGFVRAYYALAGVTAMDHPPPMGFAIPDIIPVTSFLAENFCVCDHWFAPLPASTMPNRLMALTGDSPVDKTGGVVPNPANMVLDWLSARKVSWRVYHDGLFSFFTLFLRADVLGPNFRRFTSLAADLAAGDLPEVIVIEPTYEDAPHFHANDNHPPSQIGPGENFIRDVYDLLSNSAKWRNMLVVFTHDEHGGFFDHMQPANVPYAPPPEATYKAGFATTGLRVPAIVASPLLTRKSYNECLDHTSILQFLAERFDPGGPGYSDSVNRRKAAGIGSLADVLAGGPAAATVTSPAPVAPSAPFRVESLVGGDRLSGMNAAFAQAGKHYMTAFPEQARSKLPELWHLLR